MLIIGAYLWCFVSYNTQFFHVYGITPTTVLVFPWFGFCLTSDLADLVDEVDVDEVLETMQDLQDIADEYDGIRDDVTGSENAHQQCF